MLDASIIIPCKNEGEHIRRTLDSMLAAKTACQYEIIVADDASTDDCCAFLADPDAPFHPAVRLLSLPGVGAANARNEGAELATGRVLVFCDAHIFVPDDWLDQLLAALDKPDVSAVAPAIAPDRWPDLVGYGMRWDNKLQVHWQGPPARPLGEVPILPGGCLAIPADIFRQVGGFERGFHVWGREDEEFSLRLWLFGHRLWIARDLKILHVFREAHPYTVSMTHVHYNSLRMALSHFNAHRVGKVVDLIRAVPSPDLEQQLGQLALSDIWEQRSRYHRTRQNDDNWYMRRFLIPF